MKEYAERFYKSTAWKECRAAYAKSVGGLCERCRKKGLFSPGEIVHHKIHLTPGNLYDPRVNLNPDNLISLCKECHFKEHVADKINGKNQKSRNFTDDYEFDENGQLKRKVPPL